MPPRRTRLKSGRRRLGAQRAERVASGGKLAVGRAAETRIGLAILRARVICRAWGFDEIFRDRPGTELAHVIPRSQGGADDEHNTLWLARATHKLHTAPYADGRLLLTRGALNTQPGVFWEHVQAQPRRGETGKAAYRRGAYRSLGSGFVPTTVAPQAPTAFDAVPPRTPAAVADATA